MKLLNCILAALKFFRVCIGLQDDFYNRQITQNHLFEPILNIVYETMPRDNLLNSACLELFEFIKREGFQTLILHIVENYRERLQQITYVDTFQALILRYDQMQGFNVEMDTTLFSNDGDTTPNHSKVNGNRRYQGVKEMDPAEEAYFNTSDDEDEPGPSPEKQPVQNGSSPLLKSLVDYPDDEEDGMVVLPHDPPSNSPPSSTKSENNEEVSSTSASTPPVHTPSDSNPSTPFAQTPPERLSEKRRREADDEEDELVKLSLTKRRSSSAGSHSFIPTPLGSHNSLLRRKKSFAIGTLGKDSPGPKKIEISLAGVKASTEDPKRDNGR